METLNTNMAFSCSRSEKCNYWTHFLGTEYCYHHLVCEAREDCGNDDCISGPTEPLYERWEFHRKRMVSFTLPIISCLGTTTTTTTTTSTTTTTTSTTTTSTSTTTTTTSESVGCEEIQYDFQCELDDYNIVDTKKHLSIGGCQDECLRLGGCDWWTWYPEVSHDNKRLRLPCLLLRTWCRPPSATC